MAADPHILDELRRLRARVPQLTGALATGPDGAVLAQDTPGVDPRATAALTVQAHTAAAQLADATGQGEFRELLVRGVYGYAATFAAGGAPTAVLTLLAQDRVNVGRLLLEGRRAAARVAELLDSRTAAANRSAPAKQPAKPAARTAAARTRTPRAARTTTNARTTE
ncbi:roadblock/LC7 domain-containing protein [Streptomyces gilvus]|uniref:roadblock/LC7 domain-containing protein n=1 Tax=Streptomyces gilvus TaxID=2920937 RepID=UPI001F0F84A5|nr:roadblock/LC7 domain-containing protein [Streptomyces sp. CME 23]MCH5673827.1 roadblock/LC7 domain-containing protein [Streptomyces sp. CME 23]